MAKSGFTTNSNETKKLWEEKLFRDALKESYWDRFMGGSDSPVYVKTSLESQRGDRIRFGIRMRLTGSGVTEGETLEGREEALVSHTYDLTLTQWRHAVRDDGAMSRQRGMFSISEESQDALKGRMTEKIDSLCFEALHSPVPTKIFFGGDATATTNIDSSDTLTPDLITKVATWAKTGGNRSQTPIRPIKVQGKDHYVLIVPPDVAYDLRTHNDWETAQRDARERSADNPIFTGALGVWQGVVVHEHESCPTVTNFGSGANVAGAKCTLFGAQALCWAWGERPKVVAKKFDYDNEEGYATGMIYAVGKPIFNAKDYGSVGVYVARTNISG